MPRTVVKKDSPCGSPVENGNGSRNRPSACSPNAVSVRDIAAACDMKASNLYPHFASQEDLAANFFREG